MIEKLTEAQEAKMPEYVDKYLKIGLSTETDRVKAEEAIGAVYANANLEPPKEIVWTKGPEEAIQFILKNNPGSTRSSILGGACYGSQDSYWLAFYKFFKDEVGIENLDRIEPLCELANYCGWYFPYEDIVVMCDKPTFISLDPETRLLHNENGAAIEHGDGFKVYALQGVRVPEFVIETPKSEIDPRSILEIDNAEQRMVCMRHVGLELFLSKLDCEVLDDRIDKGYRLYLVDLEGKKCEFLYMVNPSTAEIHMEGVAPGTRMVIDALAFRKGYVREGDLFISGEELTSMVGVQLRLTVEEFERQAFSA